MQSSVLSQEDFLQLFHSPRFRHIHDVESRAIDGGNILDLGLNNPDKGYGAFFTVNGFKASGKATIDNLISLNCNFVDIDIKGESLPQEERSQLLQDLIMEALENDLPFPTIVVRTKNGWHLYWLYSEPLISPSAEQLEQWRRIQAWLINSLQGDKNAKDPARILRLPDSLHLKDPSDPYRVYVHSYKPENAYSLEGLLEYVPREKLESTPAARTEESVLNLLKHGVPVGQGLRHDAAMRVAGLLLKNARTSEEILAAREAFYAWDQKVVGSPEPTNERRAELENIFNGLAKLESSKSPSQQASPLNIEKWKDIDSLTFPENRWRVDKLLPLEGFVILASVSGEGKTWNALELAKCIARGSDYLGVFKTIKGKVLYIDAENPKSELQRRGRQLGFKDEDDLFILHVNSLNLNDPEQVAKILKIIEELGINAVFVDTFRAVNGGVKEEKAEEVRTFFNRFKELKERGVVIVWLDHFRKPDRFDRNTPQKEHLFGSQDKTASVEVVVMIKSDDNGYINMYVRKNRLEKEINPFAMKMSDREGPNGRETFFTFEGELDDKQTAKENAKRLIKEMLAGVDGKTTPEIIDALKEKRVGAKNIREALKEMRESGDLDCVKHGKTDYYMGRPKDPLEDEFLEETISS